MEFNDLVHKRRSTRKFLEQKVEQSKIEKIMDAVRLAPTARNTHSSKFFVVTDREKLDSMSQMRDYGSQFMASAQAAIVVTGDPEKSDCWRENCVIAATFIQLAAVDEGLASCWVHVFGRHKVKEDPTSQLADDYLHELLPIPSSCRTECVIAFGYADYTPKPLPPYDFSEDVVWTDKID